MALADGRAEGSYCRRRAVRNMQDSREGSLLAAASLPTTRWWIPLLDRCDMDVRRIWAVLFILASLVLLGGDEAAFAQQEPACAASEFHELDFWIGDWVVLNGEDGPKSADVVIEPILGGCGLHEIWTGGQPGGKRSGPGCVRKKHRGLALHMDLGRRRLEHYDRRADQRRERDALRV